MRTWGFPATCVFLANVGALAERRGLACAAGAGRAFHRACVAQSHCTRSIVLHMLRVVRPHFSAVSNKDKIVPQTFLQNYAPKPGVFESRLPLVRSAPLRREGVSVYRVRPQIDPKLAPNRFQTDPRQSDRPRSDMRVFLRQSVTFGVAKEAAQPLSHGIALVLWIRSARPAKAMRLASLW